MRVFILGAGTSAFVGFPLASNLFSFIENYLHDAIESRGVEERDKIQKFKDHYQEKYPWLFNDVELLLTIIDVACVNNDPLLFSDKYNVEDLKILRSRFTGAIIQSFREHTWKIKGLSRNSFCAEYIEDVAGKLSKIVRDGDVFITFNWDLMLEMVLWYLRKWNFVDGWGIPKNADDFFDEFHADNYLREKSRVKVYKLHGSINWAYDDLKQEIYFGELPEYFSKYYGLFSERQHSFLRAQANRGAAIIEPSYMKTYRNKQLLSIWNLAFDSIRKAKEIFIVGYSLPEADSATKMFFFNAFKLNRSCNDIIVVNPKIDLQQYMKTYGRFPTSSVFDRLRKITEKRIVEKMMCFEDWVESFN